MSDRAEPPRFTTEDGTGAVEAPQGAESSGRHEPVPFRRYSLIATAGLVPLVLMVIALVAFQYDAQRRTLLEELKDQAVEHNILLNNVLKTVEDHLWRLGAWSQIYAVKDEARAAPVLPAEDPRH